MMMQSAEASSRLKASDFTTPVNRRTRKRVQDFSPIGGPNRVSRSDAGPAVEGIIPFEYNNAINPELGQTRTWPPWFSWN